jgi:hypothetical protein
VPFYLYRTRVEDKRLGVEPEEPEPAVLPGEPRSTE